MRQTELRLSASDRQAIEEVRSKGLHHAREVNRAHILAALDREVPQAVIMKVLGVERTAIWRTRAAYLSGGLEQALYDVARAEPELEGIGRETIRRLLKKTASNRGND